MRRFLGLLLLLGATAQAAESKGTGGNAAPASGSLRSSDGIPVRFSLKRPGYVTIVIDDLSGNRVRNLFSETWFEAGDHVVDWDGQDDVGRDGGPEHGSRGYRIVPEAVAAGKYRVRGLVRPELSLTYEFTPYTNGNPPWATDDGTGGWLGDHAPPTALLFVPPEQAFKLPEKVATGGQMLIGSPFAESGDGLVWTDLDGHRLYGQKWIGGVWTGATRLARDSGKNPVSGVAAYAAAALEGGGYDGAVAELRLSELLSEPDANRKPRDRRFGAGLERQLLAPRAPYEGILPPKGLELPRQDERFAFPDNRSAFVGGLAVHDGLLIASLTRLNQLLWVDARQRRILGVSSLDAPMGLAFDPMGRLCAVSGSRIVRFSQPTEAAKATFEPLVSKGLEDPQQLTISRDGEIFVSDRGRSHQVKIFDSTGRFLRAVGIAGLPAVGPYEAGHMNNPAGLALDDANRLWVAEEDASPKRVSVWRPDGSLDRAFYGAHQYGAGGTLDPADRSRFFYSGLEFRLDWKRGSSRLINVLARQEPTSEKAKATEDDGSALHFPSFGAERVPFPETPITRRGRTYLTNSYTTHPTNGARFAALWLERGGQAVPVAAIGLVEGWPLFRRPELAALLAGMNPKEQPVFALWQDLDGDGEVQPREITLQSGNPGPILVMPNLSFVTSTGMVYRPRKFSPDGVPRYDFQRGEERVAGARPSGTSGGGQVYAASDRWTILTTPPKPFPEQASVAGAKNGLPVWTYPSLWPGLHIGHFAPIPDRPGEMTATTRLLGPAFTPGKGEAGELWGLNGNNGCAYLFTTDGLFVATLWHDKRLANWGATGPIPRGTRVDDYSLGEECFYNTITHVEATDETFLVAGKAGSLVRLGGLEGIRRLPATTITVSQAQSARAADAVAGPTPPFAPEKKPLRISRRALAPVVDGRLDEWGEVDWAKIGTGRAAAVFSAGRLYLAFHAGRPGPLQNRPERLETLFKSGDVLDFSIAEQVPGGIASRLLVTQIQGEFAAVVFQTRVPVGRQAAPFDFVSPGRSLRLARVAEITDKVTFAGNPEAGGYEVSVPVGELGLASGLTGSYCGDLGFLWGSNGQTTERVYWHRKGMGLTSDLPSEAALEPASWGAFSVE